MESFGLDTVVFVVLVQFGGTTVSNSEVRCKELAPRAQS